MDFDKCPKTQPNTTRLILSFCLLFIFPRHYHFWNWGSVFELEANDDSIDFPCITWVRFVFSDNVYRCSLLQWTWICTVKICIASVSIPSSSSKVNSILQLNEVYLVKLLIRRMFGCFWFLDVYWIHSQIWPALTSSDRTCIVLW